MHTSINVELPMQVKYDTEWLSEVGPYPRRIIVLLRLGWEPIHYVGSQIGMSVRFETT